MTKARTPDKLAVITGTSAGIGAAVVRQLVARAWRVVGISRRRADFGDAYTHVATDLADIAAATAEIDSVVRPLVDADWSRAALVNNAASPDLIGIGEGVDASALARVYTVNTVMPVWLMGFMARNRRGDAPLRIVNVSSGAGRHATPGLLGYGSSKAALRMAAMTLTAEWESTAPYAPRRTKIAVRSYEPGVVDTDMQSLARSLSPEVNPWGGMFSDFLRRGIVVDAEMPAKEIVEFLESDGDLGFSESRLSS
jgi:NAD(P)-dependent dehydrogenase (short-subunit alcohol dehydrogenase family)